MLLLDHIFDKANISTGSIVNVKAANVELLGSKEMWASVQLYYFSV